MSISGRVWGLAALVLPDRCVEHGFLNALTWSCSSVHSMLRACEALSWGQRYELQKAGRMQEGASLGSGDL